MGFNSGFKELIIKKTSLSTAKVRWSCRERQFNFTHWVRILLLYTHTNHWAKT